MSVDLIGKTTLKQAGERCENALRQHIVRGMINIAIGKSLSFIAK